LTAIGAGACATLLRSVATNTPTTKTTNNPSKAMKRAFMTHPI
jgi:hypothetical protein